MIVGSSSARTIACSKFEVQNANRWSLKFHVALTACHQSIHIFSLCLRSLFLDCNQCMRALQLILHEALTPTYNTTKMKLTSVAALLSTASSCCSMAAAFTTATGPSFKVRHSASQLMQQYGEDAYGDQSQYYDNQQQPQYYDEQQQQNQQYYDGQQQQYDNNQGGGGGEEPTLLITDNMQQEMQRATANSDIGGLDYLALARARAEARVESVNNQSTAEDWQRLADEKVMEQGGYVSGDEAWEASLEEEGSASDFSSLGMGAVSMVEGEGGVMMTEGGLVVDNVDGDDEPQLLL